MHRELSDRPVGTTRHRELRIRRTDQVRQQRGLPDELVFHAVAAEPLTHRHSHLGAFQATGSAYRADKSAAGRYIRMQQTTYRMEHTIWCRVQAQATLDGQARAAQTRSPTMPDPILEREAQGVADATSTPPFVYELGPEGARKVLDDVQAAPIEMPDVDEKWITVPVAVGDVRVRIVKPAGTTSDAPRRALRARRRLGARQRRHARPAGPGARRRCRRRGRVRRVRPVARGPLPGRDRAGLRDRPVDHDRRRARAWTPPGWRSPATPPAAT